MIHLESNIEAFKKFIFMWKVVNVLSLNPPPTLLFCSVVCVTAPTCVCKTHMLTINNSPSQSNYYLLESIFFTRLVSIFCFVLFVMFWENIFQRKRCFVVKIWYTMKYAWIFVEKITVWILFPCQNCFDMVKYTYHEWETICI